MRLFEKAIELDSTFATAHLYLAQIYGNRGPAQKAIIAYQKAKAYANRTTEKERLRIEAAYASVIERNSGKADSILQLIAQKYPKDKRSFRALAARFNAQKQYDKAIEEYNKALNLDPNDAFSWLSVSYAYARIGDFTNAFEYLKRYAALSPGDANPLDSMAEFYLSMGKVDAAIAKFKEVQTIKPDFPSVDWRLAYCYALKEDYAEAMKSLDKHLAVYSESSPFYYLKGFFQCIQGRTKLALKDLEHASQLADSPSNKPLKKDVERLKGWIYYDRGEFDAGRIAIKKLINQHMEETPARELIYKQYHSFYLGLVNIRLGQIDSAKRHLEVIKSVLPVAERERNERTKFYYDLLHAEIVLMEGSAENALAIVQKIKPLEYPLNMNIGGTLIYNLPFRDDLAARAYQKLGKLDSAIVEYARLTTIDQTNRDRRFIPARFHYRLAKLYEQKGLTAKAMARYEHFLTVWKNADSDWPELKDAKARLGRLKGAKIK
jgi:tetratricopeptide (TPR) repeat protein